jgi:hypothetical protein
LDIILPNEIPTELQVGHPAYILCSLIVKTVTAHFLFQIYAVFY